MSRQWLDDLLEATETVVFGQVEPEFLIDRHKNKVVALTIKNKETMRHKDHASALEELAIVLQKLHESGVTGKIQFDLDMQEGTIRETTYYTNIKKKYRD